MNCNHQNNQHCHECEKAKHWDFFYAVLTIIFVIGGFYVFGWSFFTEFWIFWLIVGIVLLAGLVVWWDKKKKQEQKQKEKENQTNKEQKSDEEGKTEENKEKEI